MAIYAVLKSSAQQEATKEESLDKHFSRAKSSSRGTFDNLVKWKNLGMILNDLQQAVT